MSALAWAATYADGRTITGQLPEELPGAAVPREGLTGFELAQGSQDAGWTRILAVELAEHERLVFRRRMQVDPLAQGAGPAAVALIVGTYDLRTDAFSLLYLNGDGTMTLRAAMADVAVEAHEVG